MICAIKIHVLLYFTDIKHTHTHTTERPFVRDYPGEPVPER